MKITTKLISTVLLGAFMFAGCASSEPKSQLSPYEAMKEKHKDDKINLNDFEITSEVLDKGIIKIIVNNKKRLNHFSYDFPKTAPIAIHKSFMELLALNKKPYFMLLNENISNANGFPINNIEDFLDYMSSYSGRYENSEEVFMKVGASLSTDSYFFYFIPLDEKDAEFSVWSTEKLKDFYQKFNLEEYAKNPLVDALELEIAKTTTKNPSQN